MNDERKNDATPSEDEAEKPTGTAPQDESWAGFKADMRNSLHTWAKSFSRAKEEFVKGFEEARKKE